MYYYGIVGIAASQAFFSSPAKRFLVKRLKARGGGGGGPVSRQPSRAREQPVLGLPPNPGRDIEDAVNEVMREIEVRRRRGSVVAMPSGRELMAAVEEKLGRKL